MLSKKFITDLIFFVMHKQMSADGNTSFSSITFVATIEDGGQYLTCRGENTELPSSSIEDTWLLDVHCKSNFGDTNSDKSGVKI